MIMAQGGDPDYVMPLASQRELIVAESSGIVQSIDALSVGIAAWRLGAGRARKEDPVSAAAGVMTLVREGEHVEKGQPLFELHADDVDHLQRGRETIPGAVVIGDESVNIRPLLLERISK
jgi:thymidine phosphorylase